MKKSVILIVFLLVCSVVYAVGGGGGGGGSGSSDIKFSATEVKITENIRENSERTIQFSNRLRYEIRIDEVDSDGATVSFFDGSQVMVLGIGDEKKIDLDEDGYFDLSVELLSTSGGTGKFLFSEIHERIQTERTPQRAEETPGRKLQCGDLESLRERVSCRLELEREDRYYESALLFFPEECRALDGGEQEQCIRVYASVQQCWKEYGDERIDCVRDAVAIRSFSVEHQECLELAHEERSSCIKRYQQRAFSVIKFRLYDLEERAEEMLEDGTASSEQVIGVVAALEQLKVDFNAATTFAERRAIILEARQVWKNFMDEVENE